MLLSITNFPSTIASAFNVPMVVVRSYGIPSLSYWISSASRFNRLLSSSGRQSWNFRIKARRRSGHEYLLWMTDIIHGIIVGFAINATVRISCFPFGRTIKHIGRSEGKPSHVRHQVTELLNSTHVFHRLHFWCFLSNQASSLEHSHVPYIAILYKALKIWRQNVSYSTVMLIILVFT